MKFSTPELKGNIYSAMRECGYHFEREEAWELVFSRIIGSSASGYPRFHLYVKMGNGTHFNLHLDQKKPIYKGAKAHGGEYEGELVEQEAERIKQLLHS